MALTKSSLVANSHRCVLVFVMPIGINNIGWKMYMINAGWDVIIIALIVSCALYVWHELLTFQGCLLGGNKGQNA